MARTTRESTQPDFCSLRDETVVELMRPTAGRQTPPKHIRFRSGPLAQDPAASKRVGRWLNQAVPDAFVKVPFTPDNPHCILIARDLENQGIAVNFTTTFSARQVVATDEMIRASIDHRFTPQMAAAS
jgi:transaldolase/fructose-6-phosphate aldolase-like protein